MAFTAKAMGDGQVSDSQGAIYTCPADTIAYIRSVTLYNTHSSAVDVSLFINRSGTARGWFSVSLDQNEAADAFEGGRPAIILEAGDTLEAVAATDAVVDYTISGVEEI